MSDKPIGDGMGGRVGNGSASGPDICTEWRTDRHQIGADQPWLCDGSTSWPISCGCPGGLATEDPRLSDSIAARSRPPLARRLASARTCASLSRHRSFLIQGQPSAAIPRPAGSPRLRLVRQSRSTTYGSSGPGDLPSRSSVGCRAYITLSPYSGDNSVSETGIGER